MNEYFLLFITFFVFVHTFFIISLIIKRNDIADIAWGMGFIVLSWTAYYIFGNEQLPAFFANSLITIWGARLSFHIYIRNRGKKEDCRYLEWRKQWGKWFYLRSYGQVFLLQGFLLCLIVFPVILFNTLESVDFGIFFFLGCLLWLLGFFFEVVGDRQLKQFLDNPKNKGKIMQIGLWRYTRHPNYFGEVTMWWGVFVMTLTFYGNLFTIISPLTITFLILFVSGIPLLEKRYEGNPEFEAYKKKTSIFFPLPPKRIK